MLSLTAELLKLKVDHASFVAYSMPCSRNLKGLESEICVLEHMFPAAGDSLEAMGLVDMGPWAGLRVIGPPTSCFLCFLKP